ncbi:PD-(D/E)XK nuclease family protein [Bacillus cereus]|uniref:PD-(D/E)XK nuclease family protein n=1 Tax=Bacillus cereus TaxID=1396 RepID=UPI00156A757E|nr:PD-(D/E)XK nuclease family protein [Bacillus cereus]UDV85126.1 PD-(D/E)XK nuclease family protein [Bacillus cereus]UDV90561.1 PD-(D/E)XK nuclease family protein [Bacillus cereus]
MNNEEMLEFIAEAFEENYELLRLEGGHSLSPHVKKLALEQVKQYWKKLRNLAENVSDTEVRLTLPQQKTPSGKYYTIQGVVDVVKEDDKVVMYDIKTHDVDFVRCNKKDYEGQLNIYAYIWQSIRGQHLDGTSIIAIGETDELRKAKQRASQSKNEQILEEAIVKWNPEVPIQLESEQVEAYLEAFGEVVDRIEDFQFTPPPVEKLHSKIQDNKTFAVHVCRNCDVRFSCESYKEYAYSSSRAKSNFLAFYDDYGTEHERVEVIEANLEEEEV